MGYTGRVVKDRTDIRDLIYMPTLRPLEPVLLPKNLSAFGSELTIRDQLDPNAVSKNNCTAQALGSIIDLLRIRDHGAQSFVAEDMLYFRGRDIERLEFRYKSDSPDSDDEADTGLRSLRSAVKAFYHNGVCSRETWNAKDDPKRFAEGKDIAIADEARRIPLGSYYRLHPILNDYHAALNEVGAIYAAAEIHGGWSFAAVKEEGGVISLNPKYLEPAEAKYSNFNGNHAFVIIGYTAEGFLVLNSWGAKWGNLKLPTEGGNFTAIPGVALWSYQDWAERILDGWVLRLGVSAPTAFKYSFGPQGLGELAFATIGQGSTPRHELIGHYLHLDDGKFVETGTLPSELKSIKSTVQLINKRALADARRDGSAPPDRDGASKSSDTPPRRQYRQLLLWLAGSNETIKEASKYAAVTKDFWKNRGVYPLMVIWCSDFIENATSLLQRTIEDMIKIAGKTGTELDQRIEFELRGLGRAFWRDIKRSARRSAGKADAKKKRPEGPMLSAFEILLQLAEQIEIHVVAEGAGAILLAEMLRSLGKRAARIATVSLVMPACTVAQFESHIHPWTRLPPANDSQGKATDRRICVIVPDQETEPRLRFLSYGGSLLQLVQMSFEEELPVRRRGVKNGLEQAILANEAIGNRILGIRAVAEAHEAALRAQARGRSRNPARMVVRHVKGPEGSGAIDKIKLISMGAEALDIVADIIGIEDAERQKFKIGQVPSVWDPVHRRQAEALAKALA